MKTLKLFTAFLLVTLVITSCSKENRIEKNLWKKGGDWNINYYSYSYGSDNPTSPIFPVETHAYDNCGSFHFGKDGSGTITFTGDGSTETAAFTYSNTENELTIIVDNVAQVYKMDWEKNVMTISYDKPTTDPMGYNETDKETFILQKK